MAKRIASTVGIVFAAASFATMALAQPPAAKPAPATPAATPAAKPAEPPKKAETPAESKNIVDALAASGTHTTLVKLIKAAGLDKTLADKGPYTVFAPTDDAFKKLPAGTVDSWLKPENKEKLASTLKYHVLNGTETAEALMKLAGKESPKTLQGSTFRIEKKGATLMVGADEKSMATVTKTDNKASNGVIHFIDGVMAPKAESSKAETPKAQPPVKKEATPAPTTAPKK